MPAWRTKDMNVAVAGVPKTIDNDVDIIDRSFGFLTSVEVRIHGVVCMVARHRDIAGWRAERTRIEHVAVASVVAMSRLLLLLLL